MERQLSKHGKTESVVLMRVSYCLSNASLCLFYTILILYIMRSDVVIRTTPPCWRYT